MTVSRSTAFQLGADRSRMNAEDTQRQEQTVERLLERLYSDDRDACLLFQLLADEVGMGKTFVALAAAYSVLEHLRRPLSQKPHPHLRGCIPKIVVVVHSGGALYKKWLAEVGDFVKRCIPTPDAHPLASQFEAVGAPYFDEAVGALNNPSQPAVVVTTTSSFSRKLRNDTEKLRIVLAALMQHWGEALPDKSALRLLRAVRDGGYDWGLDRTALRKCAGLPVSTGQLRQALLRTRSPEPAALLGDILEVTADYVRKRTERLAERKVPERLRALYRTLLPGCLEGDLPLVIVDEAHNWKNLPSGYRHFRANLAPRTRRLLMLSATPFQLHPREMLALFRACEPVCGSRKTRRIEAMRAQLIRDREKLIGPVLDASAAASQKFAAAWRQLPLAVDGQPTRDALQAAWSALAGVRTELREEADKEGVISKELVRVRASEATESAHPDLRGVLRGALALYAYNTDLSAEMSRYVIRHRRDAAHRLFLVGDEFLRPHLAERRYDRHLLHPAVGIDVRGEGELPHYLLMRAISELKKGKGRTALGSDLTGCYSTLLGSAQGRRLQSADEGSLARLYVDLLQQTISPENDPQHPKVRAVVEDTLRAWELGEKTLIFCFRVNTAQQLHRILSERLGAMLTKRLHRYIGDEDSLEALRGRMSRRDGDLVGLGLDRLVPSLCRGKGLEAPDGALRLGDLPALARLSLRFGVPLTKPRVDRVFLHRACEHIAAGRLLSQADPWLQPILKRQAALSWVEHPYGQPVEGGRGVQTSYVLGSAPPELAVSQLAEALRSRWGHGKGRSVFEQAWSGLNFWLGDDDALHAHLLELPLDDTGLAERRDLFTGLRDAIRWKGILLRMVEHRRAKMSWAAGLTDGFQMIPVGQTESMLSRFAVYVSDLVKASGSLHQEHTARGLKFSVTRMQSGGLIRLVSGSGSGKDTRERVFQGFNSPLLPEVLVCTSVGQEGIDLHRHCRRVIHYDLAWNPATIEQRTGRVDRIGSKTFRQRLAGLHTTLDIGVPFLAGTYDERMFEELRQRAQTFEVLTGGELSKGDREGQSDEETAPDSPLALVSLPPEMVTDLRVELGVVERSTSTKG